jgi:hypothetical protein
MPIFVGNSTVNTAIANSTIAVDQTNSFAYATSNRNSIRPSLILDFARSQTVDPRITFTRASNAMYFSSQGVLTKALNNVPRIDFDPVTGVCNGLLIEQASTNLIRNNTMVGAVAYATIASQTISSITFSGTTATVTTSSPHGLGAYSAGVIITGASPSDYNGTFLVTTVPNSTSFSYVMRTTPATNATVMGSYTAKNTGTFPTYWANFTSNIPYGVVGSGTINGISYIDIRYYGLPNAPGGLYSVMCMDYTPTVGIPVTGGSIYTEGFYCAIVGGSTAGITALSIDNRYFGGSGAPQDLNILPSLTSTLTRFSSTTTAQSTATGTQPSYVITYTDNVAVDITLRFGMPQFEALAFPTSIIPTSGATATRTADVVSTNIQNYFNTTQGSIVMGFTQNYPTATGSFPWGLFSLQDAGASNSSRARIGGSGSTVINFDSVAAGVTDTGQTTTNSWTMGSLNKIGLSWSYASASTYNKIYALNGVSGSSTPAITLPVNNYILYIGAWNNATYPLTGWVSRIMYYPIALSNTELQTLTS